MALREWNRRWTAHGVRKHLCVRWWGKGHFFRDLWTWLRGRARWWTGYPVAFELRTRPHDQDRCYCPDGSTTYFRLEFFGVGCWGWLSRDWMPLPCACDKITWLLFPGDHEDDIEGYGAERLRAEFPDVKPLENRRA